MRSNGSLICLSPFTRMHMLDERVITLRDEAPGGLPAGSRRASILLPSGCRIASLPLKRDPGEPVEGRA